MTAFCDESALQAIIEAPPERQFEQAQALLAQYPDDPRLVFLHGSMLVSTGRLIEGYQALQRAVNLAPDFTIARFQLGFFQLTSGEPENALQTWGRLDLLPDEHYLRKFVDGLRRLIRDDFNGAVAALRTGIEANAENLPLNRDMQLIIDQCLDVMRNQTGQANGALSETSLILQRFSGRH